MKRFVAAQVLFGAALVLPMRADAALLLFNANLTGAQEVPPNGSPATGFGTVLLDDVALTITVDLSFSGLTAPASAAHIHEALFGVNGPVEFPLDLGEASGATSGSIATQVFPLSEGQDDVEGLLSGEYYFNVHSTEFPDGEIRGQIQIVPEPSTTFIFVCGAVVVMSTAVSTGSRSRPNGCSSRPGRPTWPDSRRPVSSV